tara:strand:- start:66 stop:389 length:324 start_codon:yes stop_codon:yes gene_type:complete
MRKPLIQVSSFALSHMKNLISQNNAWGLRLGAKSGGCNGFLYTLDTIKKPTSGDEIVSQDGVHIAIDSLSVFHLLGTHVDYKNSILFNGFTFYKPNSFSCGCGKSFS